MLVGCSKHAPSMLQALKDSGFVDSDGHIHDWQEHNGYHQKFSDRAKVAADKRWAKEKSPTPSKETKSTESGNRKVESGDKHCLPLELSNASSMLGASDSQSEFNIPRARKAFKPPTVEDVKLEALGIELSETEADKFFYHYETNGWHTNAGPVKNWSMALKKWKANCRSMTTFKKPESNQLQEKVKVKFCYDPTKPINSPA